MLVINFRILDDMGHEMEHAETKMDSTLKKMAKVLRMSNGKTVYSTYFLLHLKLKRRLIFSLHRSSTVVGDRNFNRINGYRYYSFLCVVKNNTL